MTELTYIIIAALAVQTVRAWYWRRRAKALSRWQDAWQNLTTAAAAEFGHWAVVVHEPEKEWPEEIG